jgi:hypothetical protein
MFQHLRKNPMVMSVKDVLNTNVRAFDHMLEEVRKTYPEWILSMNESNFRLSLVYLLTEVYVPKIVLDGAGRPYEPEYSKQVLIGTALDIPMSTLDQVKASSRENFFVQARETLRRECWSSQWYTRETFALRMRPMIEGSRKSLEGFCLERSVRDSMTRIAAKLGLTVDPKGDRTRRVKNRTVITLRGHKDVIKVQVKGVNNDRHHPERAKILGKFADEVAQDGELALPILVGNYGEHYDVPALQYIRDFPSRVIEMGERLDEVLMPMVCRLI